MQCENERVEYKAQLIDDIYKEVIAFANTDGSVIYIGVDEQGNVVGIEQVDETYTRPTNGIRDAIAPDVIMFVRYMEFISIGGLLPGLSTEDIRSGISQPCNRKLAEIFQRLRLIESYRMGIRKIYALYKDCPTQPRIEVTHNTFNLVLPNMNAAPAPSSNKAPNVSSDIPAVTLQMKTVLDYLAEYGEMSDKDLQELLNIKKARAYLLSRQMNKMGLNRDRRKGFCKEIQTKIKNRHLTEGLPVL